MLSAKEPGLPADDRLAYRGLTCTEVRGQPLPVQINADGRSWALMADLLQRYDLSAQWDADQRNLLIA